MAERVSFGWEKLEVLLAEPNVRDLITGYWEELWPYKEIPVDVDWARLLMFEAQGVFRVWAVRVNKTLAGFVAFYVQPYVLAKSTLYAIDGSHFLAPDFRDKGRIGYRMWKTAIDALDAEGVKFIMAHDNALRPLLPFFLSLGFEPRSTMFWRAV